MGLSQTNAARVRSSLHGVVAAALIICCVGTARAQCVGDCSNNGVVTINELILGVSIALGSQDASACPAFQDAQGKVQIAQLVLGVNNALHGCPATPTATAPGVATSTATEPVNATGTATSVATATSTTEPTTTGTAIIDSTPTATSTSPATVTATAVNSSTPTTTVTSPPTATVTQVPTATSTRFPIGDAVAGNVTLVTSGVGAVQSIISAVIAQVTNKGPGLTEVVVTNGVPKVDDCPITGTTSQLCTEMGPSTMHSIHLELGADMCTAAGPAGGSAQFDGGITVDSTPGLSAINDCSPIRFLGGMYSANNLMATFFGANTQEVLTATANVGGTVTLGTTFPIPACVVTSATLTLNGELVSRVPSAAQIDVDFNGTTMVMDQITFNDDCVPVKYRLTFTGPATIHSLTQGPSGTTPVDFDVVFTNFHMAQDATTNPPTVMVSGNVSSPCFGGQVGLQTLVPVAVAAGELCPNAGQISVTQGSSNSATVTYGPGGSVTVLPAGGSQKVYQNCVTIDLMECS